MYIYFVRHGETEGNRKGYHQDLDSPLNDLGRKQARKTGEVLRNYDITKLVTSDLLRARESADIIGRELGLKAEESQLFREVKRPSELYGKRHYSYTTFRVGLTVLYHLNEIGWHYSDEENIFDIKKRVVETVEYLHELGNTHERVAVVSHAFIINLFVKYMCAFNRVRRRDYFLTFFAAKRFGNASITTVAYNDDNNPQTCDWLCLKLNDTSHLRG